MRPDYLRFGIFLAPFHPLDEDPTEAIHRDLELVTFLDRLGYDEAWSAMPVSTITMPMASLSAKPQAAE